MWFRRQTMNGVMMTTNGRPSLATKSIRTQHTHTHDLRPDLDTRTFLLLRMLLFSTMCMWVATTAITTKRKGDAAKELVAIINHLWTHKNYNKHSPDYNLALSFLCDKLHFAWESHRISNGSTFFVFVCVRSLRIADETSGPYRIMANWTE